MNFCTALFKGFSYIIKNYIRQYGKRRAASSRNVTKSTVYIVQPMQLTVLFTLFKSKSIILTPRVTMENKPFLFQVA